MKILDKKINNVVKKSTSLIEKEVRKRTKNTGNKLLKYTKYMILAIFIFGKLEDEKTKDNTSINVYNIRIKNFVYNR